MKVKKMEQLISRHYLSYGVQVNLKFVKYIPETDRYIFRFDFEPGTKVKMVFDCAPDIQTVLQIPVFQPFQDGMNICLAVSSNPTMQNNLLKMLNSHEFQSHRGWLPIAVGYDDYSRMVFSDLGKMPHAMYAGATNSGKSVGLICLVLSLIYKLPVSRINLILFDIGASTLDAFQNIPHLSCPIIKDIKTGVHVVNALSDEMERRIGLSEAELKTQPALTCVIDEYAAFLAGVSTTKHYQKTVQDITALLQHGRHAKIHLVLATQNPTVNNMKVDIGNITARMAFKCAKVQNSIAILGEKGAESLTTKGSMLFKSDDKPYPVHLQGAFISPNELENVLTRIISANHDLHNKFLIEEPAEAKNLQSLLDEEEVSTDDESLNELVQIIMWTLHKETISATQIKNKFPMGNRVSAIMDKLVEMQIISDKNAKQPRKVLPQSVEEIPAPVMAILQTKDISVDEITTVFQKRTMKSKL